MERRQKLQGIINNAQNGDQDAVVQLVHRFIPIIKKYSREMAYEEAYADLVAWTVNAIYKYKPPHDTELILQEQVLLSN